MDASVSRSQLYIDGSLSGTFNAAIATTTGGTSARFGKQYDNFNEYFKVSLDNAQIYSGALSATQVKQLATAPAPSALLIALFGVVPGVTLLRRRRK